ncbi:LysR family transcriptional regulator [Bradyrhizobium sp.]|uniref:LysR family transcriptional regulator n=1 Tax=Bradyrhizobium sp. TaxID=376 RepID=UPI0039E2328F
MDFADLQVFKSVVDEGGITRAAAKLHRVPSAVTTRIKQLEDSMGVKLFHRDKQRLRLAPAGELLLGYAERLIRLSKEARDVVTGTTPRGVFRLGSLESTAASRLPAVLSEFHRRHPDVRIELATGTNDALLGKIAERKLDAAFIGEAPGDRAFDHMPVFAERLALIASAASRPIKRPSDADGLSLIAFPDGCAYRRMLQRWLGADSLVTRRVLDLSSYHAIIACVAAGTGIAFVPESVLAIVPHADVSKHRVPKAQGDITTPLVWRRGEASASVLALRDQLAARPRGKAVASKSGTESSHASRAGAN